MALYSPRTRVAGDYELADGYWESKLGPLQERPMLLTTELSFYPGSKNMLYRRDILGPLGHLPGAQQG